MMVPGCDRLAHFSYGRFQYNCTMYKIAPIWDKLWLQCEGKFDSSLKGSNLQSRWQIATLSSLPSLLPPWIDRSRCAAPSTGDCLHWPQKCRSFTGKSIQFHVIQLRNGLKHDEKANQLPWANRGHIIHQRNSKICSKVSHLSTLPIYCRSNNGNGNCGRWVSKVSEPACPSWRRTSEQASDRTRWLGRNGGNAEKLPPDKGYLLVMTNWNS